MFRPVRVFRTISQRVERFPVSLPITACQWQDSSRQRSHQAEAPARWLARRGLRRTSPRRLPRASRRATLRSPARSPSLSGKLRQLSWGAAMAMDIRPRGARPGLSFTDAGRLASAVCSPSRLWTGARRHVHAGFAHCPPTTAGLAAMPSLHFATSQPAGVSGTRPLRRANWSIYRRFTSLSPEVLGRGLGSNKWPRTRLFAFRSPSIDSRFARDAYWLR